MIGIIIGVLLLANVAWLMSLKNDGHKVSGLLIFATVALAGLFVVTGVADALGSLRTMLTFE